MTAKGGCGNEGDTGTTRNTNSERNRVLIYSYRNNIAVWPTVAKVLQVNKTTHAYGTP
jgi:hypothetical protein